MFFFRSLENLLSYIQVLIGEKLWYIVGMVFILKKKKEIRIKIFGDLYDLREDSEEDRGK